MILSIKWFAAPGSIFMLPLQSFGVQLRIFIHSLFYGIKFLSCCDKWNMEIIQCSFLVKSHNACSAHHQKKNYSKVNFWPVLIVLDPPLTRMDDQSFSRLSIGWSISLAPLIGRAPSSECKCNYHKKFGSWAILGSSGARPNMSSVKYWEKSRK